MPTTLEIDQKLKAMIPGRTSVVFGIRVTKLLKGSGYNGSSGFLYAVEGRDKNTNRRWTTKVIQNILAERTEYETET